MKLFDTFFLCQQFACGVVSIRFFASCQVQESQEFQFAPNIFVRIVILFLISYFFLFFSSLLFHIPAPKGNAVKWKYFNIKWKRKEATSSNEMHFYYDNRAGKYRADFITVNKKKIPLPPKDWEKRRSSEIMLNNVWKIGV